MDLTVLIANIDRLKGKMTDNALSIKAGRQDAIRNLRRYASGELKGTWTLDTLDAVAKVLGTAPWDLLKPPSKVSLDDDAQEMVRSLIREELGVPEPRAKKAKRVR